MLKGSKTMPTIKELKLGALAKPSHIGKTMRVVKALARHHDYELMASHVERKEPVSGRVHDLFGIIDILVVQGFLNRGIQVCGADWQPHIKKFRGEGLEACRRWLDSPNRTLELWGWRKICKIKKDGTKSAQKHFMPKVQIITWGFLMGNEEPQMIDVFDEPDFFQGINADLIRKQRTSAVGQQQQQQSASILAMVL